MGRGQWFHEYGCRLRAFAAWQAISTPPVCTGGGYREPARHDLQRYAPAAYLRKSLWSALGVCSAAGAQLRIPELRKAPTDNDDILGEPSPPSPL